MNIKLIIFDLDGVLCDARELHYESLNLALKCIDPQYVISKEEHLSKFDGLNTTKKLELLTKEKGLPKESHNDVWRLKQEKTIEVIKSYSKDHRIIEVLKELKLRGYKICVASNSIRDTVKMMLVVKGFMEYIDFFYSNQDVKNPKPSTEIYLRCMIKAEVSPKETVIVEDSHIGRKAALESGSHLFGVKNSSDVQLTHLLEYISTIENHKIKPKWQGGKMKVLIPMAGAGSRFEKAGYTFPKPLIPVKNNNDNPMIKTVVDNLNIDAEHIFIVRKEHYEKYSLESLLNTISPKCKIIQVDSVTEGAACTALLAKEYINNDEPLVIANSDQFIVWDSNEFMYSMVGDQIDGGILTFNNSHPKWSYVRLGENGFIDLVKEKEVISDIATVGVYYWAKGSEFVRSAEQMISKNIRVNGEFYIAPTFNELILDGKKIKQFKIDKIYGLGTPEDLEYFTQTFKF
jgi:HAD superfamily hydrolase (TIGR01509 family)